MIILPPPPDPPSLSSSSSSSSLLLLLALLLLLILILLALLILLTHPQVKGSKRMLLWDSKKLQDFYVYPRDHPMYRRSRVNPQLPPSTDEEGRAELVGNM